MEWHSGEAKLHDLLHVPPRDNPSFPGLSPHAARLLFHHSPLLALGVLDSQGWPWTTVLAPLAETLQQGQGPAKPLGNSLVGVSAAVADDAEHDEGKGSADPVIESILSFHSKSGEEEKIEGLTLGALGISLERRDRVKISGRIIGGAINQIEIQGGGTTGELRMGILVERSLGNCPKYLNKKYVKPHIPNPTIQSTALPLESAALQLLAKADLFFISSAHHSEHTATNHRGGPPGFVRVVQSVQPGNKFGTTLIYPEYSGNRLYQTLGNLATTPRAGLVFPDFDTGNALYVTGKTEIVIGEEAAALLPRSNLVVKIHVHAARFVENVLAFRAEEGERSPYNPVVRYLTSEKSSFANMQSGSRKASTMAQLISQTLLTPEIARFRFKINSSDTVVWKAGQYVALDFSDELDGGYSHMRDEDPKSLNDDYIRTFTVSSLSPETLDAAHKSIGSNLDIPRKDEFDITIRNVGTVTNFLFRQNIRAGLEVPLKGFGGTFHLKQTLEQSEITPYIAGGIGITPLLAHAFDLDLQRLRLYWAVHARDVGLALDTFQNFPQLAKSTSLFISGLNSENPLSEDITVALEKLEKAAIEKVFKRRILPDDLDIDNSKGSVSWYLCTGPTLRKDLLKWLASRKVIYEDFDY